MENLLVHNPTKLNELSAIILDSAITVHKEMGPGLLEAVYQHCMVKELRSRNIEVKTMVPVALQYKGEPLNKDYIIDILVEGDIILELKAIEGILPVHEAAAHQLPETIQQTPWVFNQLPCPST